MVSQMNKQVKEYDNKKGGINTIDLSYLKNKGLSNIQISKMVGVPTSEVTQCLKYQKNIKKSSGVF